MQNTQLQNSTTSLPAYLPAAAADIAGLVLLVLLFEPLRELFLAQTIRGGMLFLVAYIAFALATNVLKRLEKMPGPARGMIDLLDFTRSRFLTAVLALIVVAGFVMVEIDLNRATDSMIALMSQAESYGHEGEITLYYSFGPIFLWLMIGVLYLAAFLLPTQRQIRVSSGRYGLIEVISLTLINLMLVMTAGYLAAVFERVWSLDGRPILAGLVALLILELVFDPARLRHALKNPQWVPIFTFFALIFGAVGFIVTSLI